MAHIKLKDIQKTFKGSIVAVDDVSIEVKDREYVSLLGTSGSGKTTLLRIIAGFETPDIGKVIIDDKEMNTVPPEKRGVGFVFQDFALFPHFSVWDNVVYGPRIKGMSKEKISQIGRKVLKIVGLYSRKASFPSELSAGMKQRVGLARALASGSKLLLMDEPLGSLDARIKRDLKIKLRDWVKELELTAIHVAHSQLEAMEVSDRIFVMSHGKIIQSGSPEELYQHPNSIFIADFIGESNFLAAVVVEIDDGKTVVDVGNKLLLTSKNTKYKKRSKVVVSFRPENVKLSERDDDEEDEDEKQLHGKVVEKRFLQGKYFFTLKLRNGKTIKSKLVPSSHNAARRIGDYLSIKVDSRRVFLFPFPAHGLEKELRIL
jgi:ABC-type Fe3+/spermidine/putrescine transport system ATPase subunit